MIDLESLTECEWCLESQAPGREAIRQVVMVVMSGFKGYLVLSDSMRAVLPKVDTEGHHRCEQAVSRSAE